MERRREEEKKRRREEKTEEYPGRESHPHCRLRRPECQSATPPGRAVYRVTSHTLGRRCAFPCALEARDASATPRGRAGACLYQAPKYPRRVTIPLLRFKGPLLIH